MSKRGQVTVFLIIGIVILAVFAGIFYFTSKVTKEELLIEAGELPEIQRIKPQLPLIVEDCLEEVAVPGIYLLGIQGGVIYPEDTDTILLTENNIINYGYLNGITQFSTEKMQDDIGRFVEESLPVCLDFSRFEEQGVQIEEGEISVDSIISQNFIRLNLEYPLTATLGDDIVSIDRYSVDVPVRLGSILEEAEKVIEHQKSEPLIDYGLLLNLNNFVSVFPFDDDTTIFSLSDETSPLDGAPFVFMFAIDMEDVNSPPELDFISDFVLRKGSSFVFRVTAADPDEDVLTFFSDSEIFSVQEDGLIDDTPDEVGTFFVTFTVEDDKGLRDSQKVRFVVKE